MDCEFRIKINEESYSIEFYRTFENSGEKIYSYVDTFSPMTEKELNKLKNTISDFLWENYNKGK